MTPVLHPPHPPHESAPLKAIFFDAAGTLIHLRDPVGNGYSKVAARYSITLDPAQTTDAFHSVWKSLPSPEYKGSPARDGDRSWWRTLVDAVLDRCLGEKAPPDHLRSEFFDALYAHYALPESWLLFPEVIPVLERLTDERQSRLFVLSNFDPRLRLILTGHHIAHHFDQMIISSEAGSYKPDPTIFEHATTAAQLPPSSCLHVGDDPVADIEGARSAGLHTLHIDRPQTSLEAIFKHPHFPT